MHSLLDDALLDLLHAFDAVEASRPAWHREAACRGAGTSLFFVELGGDVKPAKLLCAECPVSIECHAFALETEAAGIWAGRGERARRKLGSTRSVAV